jgi:hypothetical protein
VPLETAAELGVVAGLGGLRALEFGLIYDGDSPDHDVPQALEAIGGLTQLQVGVAGDGVLVLGLRAQERQCSCGRGQRAVVCVWEGGGGGE